MKYIHNPSEYFLHLPKIKIIMSDIKFGTDGWRAIIAKDFTINNVARISYATADWIKNNFCGAYLHYYETCHCDPGGNW